MAAMLDQMIENDERHARKCTQQAFSEFKKLHNGRIDLALSATAHRKKSETAKRRQVTITNVCNEVWKEVMGGEHTKVVVVETIDERDREYYNNMATPLIKAQFGLDAAAGGKAILEVKAYRDDRGPGSSGMSFLRVTVCPHP